MKKLFLVPVLLALLASSSACATLPQSVGDVPTVLSGSTTIDDKLGVAVETAYQGASLAERTAIKAGFVTPSNAAKLVVLDNQAYTYVCYTRTAYDIANGRSPGARQDGCATSTKTGSIPSYADAARSAIDTIKALLAGVVASSAK